MQEQADVADASALDEQWMNLALEQGKLAGEQGEVPIGAVLVQGDQLLAAAHNRPIAARDPSTHAEIEVLRKAAEQSQNYRLPGTTLYVTIEPCMMCVGAMVHARIETLVFAAREPRAGAVVSASALLDSDFLNHRINWREGVLAEQSASLMQAFFRQRR